MLIKIILFIVGLTIITKGADLLVDGAQALAKKFKISDLIIGLTVIAFGTSLPEFFVSFNATIKESSEIAIGNVVGSNIANIFLVLGVCAIITPLIVREKTVSREIPFCLLSAIILALLGNDYFLDNASHSYLGKIDGLILLVFFGIFFYNIVSDSIKSRNIKITLPLKPMSFNKIILFLVIGFFCLFAGSKLIVDNAIYIARSLKISQSLIALTIIAVGTSLPELVTSIVATMKKNTDIAVGNIIGSNIFNTFFILGFCANINPLTIDHTKDNLDIIVSIFASLLLFIFMFTGKKKYLLERWEGMLFIIFYICYIITIIYRN
ncbi:MAG: calcium/sodium antiporter [Pseudomonadota bacterium]